MSTKIIAMLASGSIKWELIFLSAVIIIPSLPYVDQPAHIDDPLFLHTARNIIKNPLDPYGSTTNWLGRPESLFDVFSNPPLFSFYLASVMSIWGENERIIHLACIPFALLAGIGMYFLSRRFCSPALASAVFLVLSPIFFTMSHMMMPDVALCAFTICGILFFILGYDSDNIYLVLLGAFLSGLAPLIRYNGVIAPVLMVLYVSLHIHREKIKYIFSLIIPILLIVGWNLFTVNEYGKVHFFHHTLFQKYGTSGLLDILLYFLPHAISLAACFPLLFLMPLWKKKSALAALPSFCCALLLTFLVQTFAHYALINLILVFIISYGAIAFIILAVEDLTEKWKQAFPRDSVFLFLWLVLILSMHNSGIHSAAKYMITALPPVIIISLRSASQYLNKKMIAAAIASTLVFGIITATADFQLANAYKKMAEDAVLRTVQNHSPKYFAGHWGFQYYMEKYSVSAYSQMDTIPVPSILSSVSLAWPQKMHSEMETKMKILFQEAYSGELPFRTMSNTRGFQANFYSYINYLSWKGPDHVVYGVLPFSFSRAPLETLTVYELK